MAAEYTLIPSAVVSQPNKVEIRYGRMFASFFYPALGGVLFGYDIGAMAMVLGDLSSATYSGVKWHSAMQDTYLQGGVVACVTFGAMIGSVVVFRFEMALGRRKEMMIASVLYCIGALVQGVASWPSLTGGVAIPLLMAGRVVYGVGVAFAMHGAPSYIAETAPAVHRGALVSAKEAMIVVGMLLGYSVGGALLHTVGAWRYVFWAAAPVAVVMGLGVSTLPPSPRWLALKGRRVDAEKAMRYVMPNPSQEDMDLLLGPECEVAVGCGEEQAFSLSAAIADLSSTPALRAGVRAGLGLTVLQQVTGQPSVLYYVSTIFKEAGLGIEATIGLAAWKLVCTCCAVCFADTAGRKSLLLVGTSIMAVALAALTVATAVASEGAAYQSVVLVAMFAYIGGYQVGFGPVTWTIISEVFPLEQRGKAISLAVLANFTFNTIFTFATAPLTSLSLTGTFALFLVLDVYSLYFVKRHVPETKGLSLEQITRMLSNYANNGQPDATLNSDVNIA